jgi:serpin B
VNAINFADPSAPTTINDWVRRNTNGKITAIVPDPIRPGMVMYLIDAVYFKASWTYRFDTSATVDDFFTRADGSKIPCRMMSQRATYPFLIAGDVRGIDLPYGDAGFSMTIILPPPGVDIDVFIANLTVDQWESWTGRLSSREVTLSMPKFRIEYAVKLNDALLALGMGVAFSNVADFTRIDRRGSLKITEVQHKSFVQVDEEGTEAAAVTSVGFEVTAGSGEHLALRLDRPFIYAIRENTSGTILFIGKMAEPKW